VSRLANAVYHATAIRIRDLPVTLDKLPKPVRGERRMATSRQSAAAKRNVKKAASAARRKRTIANLPKKTRTALGKKGAAARKRR
jgi:hypothetical protein